MLAARFSWWCQVARPRARRRTFFARSNSASAGGRLSTRPTRSIPGDRRAIKGTLVYAARAPTRPCTNRSRGRPRPRRRRRPSAARRALLPRCRQLGGHRLRHTSGVGMSFSAHTSPEQTDEPTESPNVTRQQVSRTGRWSRATVPRPAEGAREERRPSASATRHDASGVVAAHLTPPPCPFRVSPL